MDRAYEKQKAKEFLKGNYTVPVLAGLLIFCLCLLFFIPFCYFLLKISDSPKFIVWFFVLYFLEIIFLLFFPILQFGYIKTIIDMTKTDEHVTFRTFVDNLGYIGKAMGCFWWRALWLYIWEIACMAVVMIPVFIMIALSLFKQEQSGIGTAEIVLISISAVALLATYVIIIWKSLAYSCDIFILAENPENGVIKSLSDSVAITKHNIGNLFVFDLSFIGWGLLSIFTLGISYLWTAPYYTLAKYNYYRAMKAEKEITVS